MSKVYFCLSFAKAVLQNGVFNPFRNLVGRLKLCFAQRLMITLVSCSQHPVIEN